MANYKTAHPSASVTFSFLISKQHGLMSSSESNLSLGKTLGSGDGKMKGLDHP